MFPKIDVGTATGIVGMVTGVYSLIQVSRFKSQDLRIERHKRTNSIQNILQEVEALGEKMNASKMACLAARGKFNSGEKIKFEEFHKNSKEQITHLATQFSKLADKKIKRTNLERDISELDNIEKRLSSIRESYKKSLAEDDRARDQLATARNFAARN